MQIVIDEPTLSRPSLLGALPGILLGVGVAVSALLLLSGKHFLFLPLILPLGLGGGLLGRTKRARTVVDVLPQGWSLKRYVGSAVVAASEGSGRLRASFAAGREVDPFGAPGAPRLPAVELRSGSDLVAVVGQGLSETELFAIVTRFDAVA